MKNIKDNFIPYEEAKELKELGFGNGLIIFLSFIDSITKINLKTILLLKRVY